MVRFVREFVEVEDHAALDQLLETLTALRNSLPEGAEADIRMQGDDVFGRRLSISYLRPQTAEEAACDARYEHAGRATRTATDEPISLAA